MPAIESRALANAKDLYNQAKELIDAGDTPATARQVDNLLVLAKLSAEIAQAEALTVLAAAADRLTLPMLTVRPAEPEERIYASKADCFADVFGGD